MIISVSIMAYFVLMLWDWRCWPLDLEMGSRVICTNWNLSTKYELCMVFRS